MGLCLDRYLSVPMEVAFAGAVLALGCRWLLPSHAALGLYFLFTCLAAAYHHQHRDLYSPGDIGDYVSDKRRICSVRGVLVESPTLRRVDRTEVFGPARRVDRGVLILEVRSVCLDSRSWTPSHGHLRVRVELIDVGYRSPLLDEIELGDEIEAVGLLAEPPRPTNPGEWDFASQLRDQRIRAELQVVRGKNAISRLDDPGHWSLTAGMARLRGRFTRLIDGSLSGNEAALARALLLGDGTAMDPSDWEIFARTGVIHVLAISGQHLVILAGFVWFVARILMLSRNRTAILVMLLVAGYAVLTGLRPSATRAAVMVAVACGGILLRRPVLNANSFAFAAIVVALFNPTDPFTTGCQLSFLSVFVLIWGIPPLVAGRKSPLDSLMNEMQPVAVRLFRALLRAILFAYLITVVLAVVNAPLVIARQNLVCPVGILLGPPLVLLTTIALLLGFLFLLIGLILPFTAFLIAPLLKLTLGICATLVQYADAIPGSSLYVPNVSLIWLIGFHLLLAIVVLVERSRQLRWALGLTAWTCLGLIGWPNTNRAELRVTFLAVGHGGCAVLETPDGRAIVYDTGSMAGPDAVRRIVAPYLWHRGIRRVDELFLSHADLDHFNGVSELIRRFPVGRVTMTPTFAYKSTPEVAEVLVALKKQAIPMRVVQAGQRFVSGDVGIEVLHPGAEEFAGSENEHSLVLLVTHREHTLLFTGDLEKQGTERLLRLPPRKVDLMMAPHHGSRTALTEDLLQWARPTWLVVHRGGRLGNPLPESDPIRGMPAWDTWTRGAITLRSQPTGLVIESYRNGERKLLSRR